MDGDGGGCDSDRGMSSTRLAARANHAVAAELHSTCGIPPVLYWYPPPVLETYVLDETQPFTLTHASEGMRTNISHLAPTKYIDGA